MATNHVYDTPLVTDDVPNDLALFGYVTNDTLAGAMRDIVANLDYLDASAKVPGLTRGQVSTLVGLLNRIQYGIAQEFQEV